MDIAPLFMKKYLFLFIISIISVTFFITGAISLKNSHTTQGKIYNVTLSKKGFTPQQLHIKQYDTVVFKTNLKENFWPASDLHPTHGIYPEFDPLEPVANNAPWSFIFKKVGKWNFHNHLDPWARGTIYVEK